MQALEHSMASEPGVTICVLTFGDYPDLIRRALESIRTRCQRSDYRLVVGANAASRETCDLLRARFDEGGIDRLIVSRTNLNKCPMMRRMFEEVETEYIWWFDDDSYIVEDNALAHWLQTARMSPASTAQWGLQAWCDHPCAFTNLEDPLPFVRS